VWSASDTQSAPLAVPASSIATQPRTTALSVSHTQAETRTSASRSAPHARASHAPHLQQRAISTAAAPQNTAEEDAAYLRVLALLREGRREEARLAAASYLGKFPKGFRRAEVERIAWPTEPK
jgi:hypothetical protein